MILEISTLGFTEGYEFVTKQDVTSSEDSLETDIDDVIDEEEHESDVEAEENTPPLLPQGIQDISLLTSK